MFEAIEPSKSALERADEFLEDLKIEVECDKHRASCLRDDLADNRAWMRLRIAALIDETATAAVISVS